ncbi:MAG TPA: hypothetical protein VFH21_04000, partial [Burkholderiales bacterium]|nr:hypothetical protein [Burkholderiales bacterium]
MNTLRFLTGLLSSAALLGTACARADLVADWNVITVNANATSGADLMMQARAIAMVHAAIYDAVNAIDRRYSVYAVDIKAP